MKAIYEGGPVETAFTVYADFANYVSGVYHHVSGAVDGGPSLDFFSCALWFVWVKYIDLVSLMAASRRLLDLFHAPYGLHGLNI